MTTEDDFQKQLDEHPDDHHTRLVFADWLQERGDKRAEGYRALGRLKRYPVEYKKSRGMQHPAPAEQWAYHLRRGKLDTGYGGVTTGQTAPAPRHSVLPADWLTKIGRTHSWMHPKPSRRNVEDAAALAFAQLPTRRRTELLAPKDTAPGPRARKKTPRKVRKPAARKSKGKEKK